jgi:hypothetical protein
MTFTEPYSFDELTQYLQLQENIPADIEKIEHVLRLPRIILEIGCGTADVAWKIALKNPDVGVIASDKYDWSTDAGEHSYYRRIAVAWKEKKLPVQENFPHNLVLLRADTEIFRLFPDRSIDTVLLMNPEPNVARSFLFSVSCPSLLKKLKPGDPQILVIPFSRRLGLMASGSLEFDHDGDCPRGISYLTAGPLAFRKGPKEHWGLDLSCISSYSKNSTLNDVYIFSNQFIPPPLSFWECIIRKIF